MRPLRTKEKKLGRGEQPRKSGWGTAWGHGLVQASANHEKNTRTRSFLDNSSFPQASVIQGKIPNFEVDNRVFKADEVTTVPDTAEVSNPTSYDNQNKAGYLPNVIAMPGKAMSQGDLDIKDRPASEIATEYAKGFGSASDRKNRLKIVVNVNKRDDPWEANPRQALTSEVNGERAKVNGLGCKVAVIGTLWSNQWIKQDDQQNVDVSAVRQVFNQSNLLDAGTAKTGYTQKFKWSGMREKTFKSAATTAFKNQMTQRGLKVFVQTGDGDIISVKHTGEGDQDLADKGIYNRMDDFLAQNGDKEVISGGVTYRGVNQGGDAPAPNAWVTKVVGDLDFQHRQAMQEEVPSSPWFAEPNTFVKADLFARSDALFKKLNKNKDLKPNEKDWAYATWITQQSPDIGSFMQLLPSDLSKTAVSYDKLSIMSGAGNHDQHETQGASDTAITRPEFLKRLVDLKSTSIEFAAWTNGVQQAYMAKTMATSRSKKKLTSRATWLQVGKVAWDAELLTQNNVDLNTINAYEMNKLTGEFVGKYANKTISELLPDDIAVEVGIKFAAMAKTRADMLKGAIAKFDASTPKARGRYGAGQISFEKSLESAQSKQLLRIRVQSWQNKVQFFNRLLNFFSGYTDPLSKLIRPILMLLRYGCKLMLFKALKALVAM